MLGYEVEAGDENKVGDGQHSSFKVVALAFDVRVTDKKQRKEHHVHIPSTESACSEIKTWEKLE